MIDGAPSCGGQAGAGQLNETIITYLGNLSMSNYKWFRCCGIAAGKVETRNVKVETGRAVRVKRLERRVERLWLARGGREKSKVNSPTEAHDVRTNSPECGTYDRTALNNDELTHSPDWKDRLER